MLLRLFYHRNCCSKAEMRKKHNGNQCLLMAQAKISLGGIAVSAGIQFSRSRQRRGADDRVPDVVSNKSGIRGYVHVYRHTYIQ